MKGVYLLLKEAELESSLKGAYPVLRNMDVNLLQKTKEGKDMSDKKVQELVGLLGLVLQSIREMDINLQALSVNSEKVEVKRAPVVLMEDNLTKAKRALMVTKQLYPTGLNIQALE